MPSWLAKAKAALKPPEPKQPEPFRLECVCGEVFEGTRTHREQRLTCRICDSELFVLPESVYPVPKLPVSPLRKQQRAAPEPESEPEPESAPADEAELAGPADQIKIQPKPKPKPRPQPRSAEADSEPKPDAIPAQTIAIDHRRGIWDRRRFSRRMITPFRALLCGILAVVVITGYAIIHSRNIERAQVIMVEEERAGRAALEEGSLAKAAESFEKLHDALITLGSDDQQSRALLQLCYEVRAANNLIPNSLYEMITEAIDKSNGDSYGNWDDAFDFAYEGKWIVLEAPVPTDITVDEMKFDIPLIVSDESAVVVASTDDIQASDLGAAGETMIIAGQLQSCIAETEDGRTWVVHLEPGTVFLWSNLQTYELLGFDADDVIQDVLAEQTRRMGGEP